ncbi:MAG TPA: VOC family protein [Steroidobacteraceae bacterium]|nr:VOC family protein [Steroidobacteraceae bacterium]
MKRSAMTLVTASMLFMLAGDALAGTTLDAARIGAVNVPALENFYESAFGLKEVNRIQLPGMLEVMLNFGATAQAAKRNPSAQIVIMHRATDAVSDTVPHLILDVTDIKAAAAAIEAAGGHMDGKPRPFGKTGLVIGLARDPAGNRLELIQRPRL